MGQFSRNGTFQDRSKFLEGLKGKMTHLRQGTLRGMKEEWKSEAGKDTGHFKGMGVSLTFTVEASTWKCDVEVPIWLPMPQSKIEHMLDKELEGLKGL